MIRPFVVGFDNSKPQIRFLSEGLTINVRPEIQDSGVLLTCALEVNEITEVKIEKLSQAIDGKPVSLQVPECRTMRLDTQVRTNPETTLVIGGLRLKHNDQPEESLLVLVQAERMETFDQTADKSVQPSHDEHDKVSRTTKTNKKTNRVFNALQPTPGTWEKRIGHGVKSDAKISGESDLEIASDGITVEGAMQEKLNQKVTLKFNNTPITAAIHEIAVTYQTNMILDTHRTETNDTPGVPFAKQLTVSMDVNGIPLRAALSLLCAQQDLAFEAKNEVVRIFEPVVMPAHPTARDYLTPRNYMVANLVLPIADRASDSDGVQQEHADFTGLIELIRTTIEPDTWQPDGAGRLSANENTLSVVVRQTPDVHDQIVDLLSQLPELQDVQITTGFRVIQFNTPQQRQWLDDNVTFHQRVGSHPWALLPVDTTDAQVVALSKQGRTLSAPKITTFVGQEAMLDVAGVSDFRLPQMSSAVPLTGDKLLKLTYAAGHEPDARHQQPRQQVTQIIGNGQTLLLDVTETVKPGRAFASDSSMSKAERVNAEREEDKRVKLAIKRRGRIIVAITPLVVRAEEEEELILETP